MDRRKAMKVAAGVIAGGGAGLFAFSKGLKPEPPLNSGPQKLDYEPSESNWKYSTLDPAATAELAYNYYPEGSCMYATVKSVVSQLAVIHGEPYTSFPIHMFKYGHGGVGGYGSVCGALNGAAAVIGLVVSEKDIQDKMIGDFFKWYEKEPLPAYNPSNPGMDFIPAKSTSNSVLCHASNTNWCNQAGFNVNSKERKERCRRLTGDIALKVATVLNELHANAYVSNVHGDESSATCLTCHGSEGKLNNTSVKMSCTSCHTESLGHRVFADIHYKLME